MFSNPGELLRLQDIKTLSRLTDAPLPDMPVLCSFLLGANPNRTTKNIIDNSELSLHEKEKKAHWKTTFNAEIHKDTDLIQKQT